MIKDKNKEVYTSPITEALELCFEGVICTSGEVQPNGTTQGNVLDSGSFGFTGWD